VTGAQRVRTVRILEHMNLAMLPGRWLWPLIAVVTALALAVGAGGDSPSAGAGVPHASTRRRRRSRTFTGGVQGRYDQRKRHRDLVVGGRPTGGGKFPFLVIVDWFESAGSPDNPTGDPRVRALRCLPRMLPKSRSFHSLMCTVHPVSFL
jgi:hypothetical protein